MTRAAIVRRKDTVDVCERHRSERPSDCEGLVYEARGAEADGVRGNARCKRCRRPLARILSRVAGVKSSGCDFCYAPRRRVAVAASKFLGVPFKICEGCASDALRALRGERGEDDAGDDDE